jgi:hypothetical protein
MPLRYFWEDWMEMKDDERYPSLENHVTATVRERP